MIDCRELFDTTVDQNTKIENFIEDMRFDHHSVKCYRSLNYKMAMKLLQFSTMDFNPLLDALKKASKSDIGNKIIYLIDDTIAIEICDFSVIIGYGIETRA